MQLILISSLLFHSLHIEVGESEGGAFSGDCEGVKVFAVVYVFFDSDE